MAEYKVVEVTQLDAGTVTDEFEPDKFESVLSEFCPEGWEIVSARFMPDHEIHRALVLLAR